MNLNNIPLRYWAVFPFGGSRIRSTDLFCHFQAGFIRSNLMKTLHPLLLPLPQDREPRKRKSPSKVNLVQKKYLNVTIADGCLEIKAWHECITRVVHGTYLSVPFPSYINVCPFQLTPSHGTFPSCSSFQEPSFRPLLSQLPTSRAQWAIQTQRALLARSTLKESWTLVCFVYLSWK